VHGKLGKTSLQVSPIGLGTVEIGVADYGVGHKGLPTDAEAETLLKSAVEAGITYIDTARGYGVAEERIGKSGITKMEGVVVGTKCGQWLKNEPDLHGSELEKRIRDDIDTSRTLLKLEVLPLVQLHIELPDFTNLNELIEIMSKLKAEEKVLHVGIASRGEDVPRAAVASGFFETLQVAYSILDQRMEDIVKLAHENKIGVLNRSVLLKGALTPARENLPEALNPLKANADAAAAIAQKLEIDLPTLAIRFAASNAAISTILIGTTKPQRIVEAIAAAEAGPLPADMVSRLQELGITAPEQVDPAKWPKL
jgi:aryl-alcohol dehydrogenase-like predicted oxidoreductase